MLLYASWASLQSKQLYLQRLWYSFPLLKIGSCPHLVVCIWYENSSLLNVICAYNFFIWSEGLYRRKRSKCCVCFCVNQMKRRATLICCTSSITPTLVRVLFLGWKWNPFSFHPKQQAEQTADVCAAQGTSLHNSSLLLNGWSWHFVGAIAIFTV